LISNLNPADGDDEDEDMVSEDQEGFLVSDGHLSDEEYNFSDHSN
jgi:hypothetical protein